MPFRGIQTKAQNDAINNIQRRMQQVTSLDYATQNNYVLNTSLSTATNTAISTATMTGTATTTSTSTAISTATSTTGYSVIVGSATSTSLFDTTLAKDLISKGILR